MTKTLAIAAAAMWATLATLDFFWLGTATKLFYRPKLGALLSEEIVWVPAILFYVLHGLGVAFFVLRPALNDGDALPMVLLCGAFFGLVAYGAYDLTNHATIPNWPLSVTIVDMAWGAIVTGLASTVGVWAARKFGA